MHSLCEASNIQCSDHGRSSFVVLSITLQASSFIELHHQLFTAFDDSGEINSASKRLSHFSAHAFDSQEACSATATHNTFEQHHIRNSCMRKINDMDYWQAIQAPCNLLGLLFVLDTLILVCISFGPLLSRWPIHLLSIFRTLGILTLSSFQLLRS